MSDAMGVGGCAWRTVLGLEFRSGANWATADASSAACSRWRAYPLAPAEAAVGFFSGG